MFLVSNNCPSIYPSISEKRKSYNRMVTQKQQYLEQL